MTSVDILRAKLYFPMRGKGMVSRPRLVAKLSAAMDSRVTTVVAPAGYGKTVLASEWFAQASMERRAAFLSLDAQDNDPSSFASYICASFASLKNEREWEESCIACAEEQDPMHVITKLASKLETLEDDSVIFIDDYHLITDQKAHQLLLRLIELRIDHISYVIIGRSLPYLPLSRWLLEGSLSEITPDDLAFTDNEADELLGLDEAAGEALKSDLSYVKEVAEGWAAGLRLGLFALNNTSSANPRSRFLQRKGNFAWQYLWEEVFRQQSADMQAFLMATSIVDRLNVQLGDALLAAWQWEDGEARHEPAAHLLSQMLSTNLFVVELGGEGGWCRYHHLMREYSLNRLRVEYPEACVRLDQAACEWYFANGLETQAVSLAMTCGDWDYAADILQRAGMRALSKGWGLPIIGWFSLLPDGITDRYPLLAVLEAWGYVLSSRADNLQMVNSLIDFAENRLDRVEPSIADTCRGHLDLIKIFRHLVPDLNDRHLIDEADMSNALSLSPCEDPRGAGVMVLGWSSLAEGKIGEAIDQFARSRDISLQAPHYFSYVESAFSTCYALARSGRVQEALSLCDLALDLLFDRMSVEQGETPLVGPLLLVRGLLFVMEGSFEKAEEELESGMRLATGCLLPHYQLIGTIASFDMLELQGRGEEAFPLLDKLESVWPDVSFCAAALRIEHCLNTGSDLKMIPNLDKTSRECLALAETHADKIDGLGPLHGGYAFERAWSAWLRLMVALGLCDEAIDLIDRRMLAYGDEKPGAVVAGLRLIRSYALFEKGDDGALDQFDEAISLVGSPSHLRTLTLDGRFPVLSAKWRLQFQRLEANEASVRRRGAESSLLTQKERKVIQLAGSGLSNKAIAQRMNIGGGTVKQHMNHLMRKLGARNRTEAYVIAKDLGLL